MATLYTFGPSHYCERARWSLDLCRQSYREVRWAPGPHLLAARRIAPATTVPILDHGSIIQGSGAIVDWLESTRRTPWHRPASPAETGEIGRLTTRADERLGVAVRRLFYATGLPIAPTDIAKRVLKATSWTQRAAGWLMWPVTRRLITRSMRATQDDIPQARADVERELEALDTTLGNGRRFLLGDHLTGADIATASLLSPIARPPQHPVYGTAAPSDPEQQIINTYRDRPCVRWALRLYEDFR